MRRERNNMIKGLKLFCVFALLIGILAPANISIATDKVDYTKGIEERLEGTVALYIGSSQAFVDNVEKQVDPSNVKVKPFIKNDRTLVPVRFISESLGAEVGWDKSTSTVTVKSNNKTVKLVIGSKKMTVGKSSVEIDVAPLISEGRTYLPLRSLVEALGKKVFYDRGLIIIGNNENLFDVKNEKSLIDQVISKVNNLPVVGSKEELKKLLGNTGDNRMYKWNGVTVASDKAVSEAAPVMNGAEQNLKSDESGEQATGGDYSGTNVQVQGVDEADVVKTDGEYIYQVNNDKIVVIKAYSSSQGVESKMKVMSTIQFENSNFMPMEMYIDGNYLVAIGNYYEDLKPRGEIKPGKEIPEENAVDEKMSIMPYYPQKNTTKAIIYDMTDKAQLKVLREIEIEGNYVSSRKIDDVLYLVANQYVYNYGDVIPLPAFKDSLKGDQYVDIEPTSIRYFPDSTEQNFMTIGAVDIKNQEEVNIQTYLGAGQNIYSSRDNLYVAVPQYKYDAVKTGKFIDVPQMPMILEDKGEGGEVAEPSAAPAKVIELSEESVKAPDENEANVSEMVEKRMMIDPSFTGEGFVEPEYVMEKVEIINYIDKSTTLVYKFSLDGVKMTYLNKGEVPGNILNQFSMDETNGYFRIATTKGNAWEDGENMSKNNVYILDDIMSITGKLEGMAPGERIYSVRFMGDRGYVVTFKTVDPLFVIDLKDPKNPSILGELKIPGFSDYLHPYDENHIIGFGKDTIESDGRVLESGLKIALFDVSDVKNPIQKFAEKIGDRGSDSEVLRNHKALLFSKNKNLLAFPVSVMEVKNQGSNGQVFDYGRFTFQGAYVYNLDLQKGFNLKGKITHVPGSISDDMDFYNNYENFIERILYIDDNLYTLSKAVVKVNAMDDLKERDSLKINAK